MTITYVFRVISSRTAVKSNNSISSDRNSSRTRKHECLNALISSEVRSYRFPSNSVLSPSDASGFDCKEVAMTRKVVRSNKMTSVALHALAKVLRCLERMAAFGIRV